MTFSIGAREKLINDTNAILYKLIYNKYFANRNVDKELPGYENEIIRNRLQYSVFINNYVRPNGYNKKRITLQLTNEELALQKINRIYI